MALLDLALEAVGVNLEESELKANFAVDLTCGLTLGNASSFTR